MRMFRVILILSAGLLSFSCALAEQKTPTVFNHINADKAMSSPINQSKPVGTVKPAPVRPMDLQSSPGVMGVFDRQDTLLKVPTSRLPLGTAKTPALQNASPEI